MLKIIDTAITRSLEKIRSLYSKQMERSILHQLGSHGNNCRILYPYYITASNIYMGNDVFVNKNVCMLSSEARINIGSKVLVGPNVTMITGDHNYHNIGQFMYDVKIKRQNNDIDIDVEDDVWIGANVVILKGVRVGRGSIIGAGSVVVKSIEPYAIVAGNPARVVKKRFTQDEVEQHENLLY